MSVIKIPSGSIYEKSTNILPNNIIRRIDTPYNAIAEKKESNANVYTFVDETFNKIQESNSSTTSAGTLLGYQYGIDHSDNDTIISAGEMVGIAYIKAKLTYCIGIIEIPKIYNNTYITEVFANLSGDDTTGKKSDVSYSIVGDYSSYEISNEARFIDDKVVDGTRYMYWFVPSETIVSGKTDETESPYNLSSYSIGIPVPITVEQEFTDNNRTIKPTVSLNINNNTRIGVAVTERANYYEISYSVLAGYEIDEMTGYNPSVEIPNMIVPLSGFRKIFEPIEISFSMKGVRIALDIKENVAIISDLGNSRSNKFIFYEGNELISSEMKFGNYPIYGYFRSIYENYKNGKETATIKCALGNYFDYNTNNLCITTDKRNLLPRTYASRGIEEYNGIIWTFHEDGTINANGTATADSKIHLNSSPITLDGGTYRIYGYFEGKALNYCIEVLYEDTEGNNHKVYDYGTGITINNVSVITDFSLKVQSLVKLDVTFSPMLTAGASEFPYESDSDLPSTFRYLDQVIPMRYAVQRRILPDGTTEFYREDVPLSTYASGAPKKFQVLGVQYDYSGIGYQTLSLQEIAEN